MYNGKRGISFKILYKTYWLTKCIFTNITGSSARKEACAPSLGTLQSVAEGTANSGPDTAPSVALLPPASLNNTFRVREVGIRGAASHPPVNLREQNAAKGMRGMERCR